MRVIYVLGLIGVKTSGIRQALDMRLDGRLPLWRGLLAYAMLAARQDVSSDRCCDRYNSISMRMRVCWVLFLLVANESAAHGIGQSMDAVACLERGMSMALHFVLGVTHLVCML